jgi:D-serine deaminase-like pyridoxal phosphate-dependent protein
MTSPTSAVAGTVTSPGVLAERVARLRERPVPATDKALGWLTAAGPVTAAGLAAARPALWDFELPVMVLHESALAHNIQAMAAYCAAAGVSHAPHGKTTMAPQLIARQLAAGAWAVSAATAAQARVYRAFGVPRVLIASQLTRPEAVQWVGRELAADPGFECYTYADSLAGVALLDDALRADPSPARPAPSGRPLPVLVELGYPGGRTGCRTMDEALAVAAAVHVADRLELAGAAGFEGGLERAGVDATLAAVTDFIINLRTLGERLPGFGDGKGRRPILSAGGSSYFDVVSRELALADARAVLRSGAYIAHDHGHYAESGPASRPALSGVPPSPRFAPALELWAAVLSVPEPGLAIVNAGRRDISCDQGMPVPLRVRRSGVTEPAAGLRLTNLDDQHGYLSITQPITGPLAPGDLVSLGSTHPCTTMDKWQSIPVVDDDDHVIDAVHTFF